nr:unnamed protein product [Callosobruchus analis]
MLDKTNSFNSAIQFFSIWHFQIPNFFYFASCCIADENSNHFNSYFLFNPAEIDKNHALAYYHINLSKRKSLDDFIIVEPKK